MVCAWRELLNILPTWLRYDVDKLGRDGLQELRLRLGQPPLLITVSGQIWLSRCVVAADMCFCINTASKYSPWLTDSTANGYVTAPGGHRIGICGNVLASSGAITSLSGITSLCIRVARDFPGLSKGIPKSAESILIIGKPGSGKTTLLRDLIRQRSDQQNACVCVIDERAEIFPRANGFYCFDTGKNTDVLTGCTKMRGIESVVRSMGPDTVAIDEITAAEDCTALFHAGWCGVKLFATAHAGNMDDLLKRPLYRPIIENRIFDAVVTLHSDKSWYLERLNL